MKKFLTLTMTIVGLFLSTSSFAAIIGSLSVCVGSTTTLTDTPSTGGTWSSSDPSIAAVTSSTSMMAIITGMAPGTATITKWGTPTPTSVVVTINANPAALTGTFLIDVGCTSTLSSTPAGGTWTSLSPSIATVGASTGTVTGVSPGLANIRYSLPTGCFTQSMVTISSVSPDSVMGPNSVCVGSTISLFSTYAGTWSITGSSIATITSGGVVTGVGAGSVVVTHTASTMCSVVVATHIVTVTSSATAGTLSGLTSVAAGGTITLSSTITGGTWSNTCASTATIGASTGIVTGITAGTCVMTYTKTTSCGTATATYTITVTPAATTNCISGNVKFTGAPYVGSVKVWLIKYNASTSMLTAVDSQIVSCPDTMVGYSFCGMGTDSFRVKASRNPMTAGTGYLPTYHANSAYWSTATVINHVAPSNDINKHIIMNYGTASTGHPGFIGGLVTSGANKGTADGAPVVGLLVYCVNSITGAILQTSITDATGHYGFGNLPVGEPYKIYPELINYVTVPYPDITLGGSFLSMPNADFIQHTIGRTITPIPAAVGSVLAASASINVFPNPASGALNVQWNAADAGTGVVTITDITGRAVMTDALDMTQNNGTTRLNISGISAGMYIVSIKANGINYNAKIAIQ